MRILEAWRDGRHLGRFEWASDRAVTFVYDADAPSTPVSLSLPREGPHPRHAAARFLDNLLPDREPARVRMASAYGAADTSVFELLAHAGQDVAGGLVLTPEGRQPVGAVPLLDPALDRDIAGRIAAVLRDQDAWADAGIPARFSLAGAQGKFALARVDGDWYWPNATVPSTHIVKPGHGRLPGLEEAEAAALGLAARVGIPAPVARVFTIEDQSAYLVERFDRAPGGVTAKRLPAEDLAQALGVAADRKYAVTARQVIELLRGARPGGGLGYDFVRLLAFNVIIGNSDAHAKNYSVLLGADGVRLAPLYDAVPICVFPEYQQTLAMRIAGARRSAEVTPSHWRKLAAVSGLDPERALDVVARVARGVADQGDEAWHGLPGPRRDILRTTVERAVRGLL